MDITAPKRKWIPIGTNHTTTCLLLKKMNRYDFLDQNQHLYNWRVRSTTMLNHQKLHINTLTPNILPVITSLNIPCGFLLKRKSFYLLCPALDTAYVSMFQIELGMIGTCYNGREDWKSGAYQLAAETEVLIRSMSWLLCVIQV